MNPGDLLAALKRTVEQLAAFNEIAKALTSTLEVGEVLNLVMQKVSELMRPSNWSLLLLGDDGRLYFEICVGEGADTLRAMKVLPGEGIAGTVFLTGEPKLVEDVAREPSFAARFDVESRFRTRSVLAVPLKARGRTMGVIELVSREGDTPFTQLDLQTMVGLADYAAIAIDNARNFKRVQELTITDEHTGLSNARHLRDRLEAEIVRARRFKHALSLIFLDLDGFKQVNDTHGHLVGSALLKEMGTLLVDSIRQVDLAHRYGGDEFAVILIETDAVGARYIAERVRERIQEHVFMYSEGLAIRLSASVGYATYPDHADSAMGLLEAADRAMYRAKGAGRNAVVGASPKAEAPNVVPAPSAQPSPTD